MPVKVLVVDDSAFMRAYLRRVLESQPDMEVDTARDCQEALAKIPELRPDVVTLDVHMPGMDGLTCLSRIMAQFPCPVLMVSSLTQHGAWQTLEALQLGAVDYVPKPQATGVSGGSEWATELIDKVRAASKARVWPRRPRLPSMRSAAQAPGGGARPRAAPSRFAGAARAEPAGLVLIGASTGGPRAVEEVVARLPADFPLPVLVAQHMPPGFTRVFAERLGRHAQLSVEEVNGPTPLRPGEVLVARGGADMVVAMSRGGEPVAMDVAVDPAFRWHPSVERMVRSAMDLFPPDRLIAVQLTGMGSDGADAMAELRRRGGWTVAESEETAVIFGMPRELIQRGGASAVLPLEAIARGVVEQAARVSRKTAR